MFRDDPDKVPRAPRVCLVAPPNADGVGLDEPTCRRALALAASGCAVHILGCDRETATRADLKSAGIVIHRLETFDFPASLALSRLIDFPRLHDSDLVRSALASLHQGHAFDAIEFADRDGLGFRSVQAKRHGLGFEGVTLAVRLEGPSQHLRQRRQEWPNQPADLAIDFCERYAFEHADRQLVADVDVIDEVRALGWKVAPSVRPGLQNTSIDFADYSDRRDQGGPFATDREEPLVTVCVPYFNLAPYLEEALTSLADQTYAAIEVIVIDDGSTDPGARRVFRGLQGRFPRFRFLMQENAGIGATRNRGLREARGEYFLPMDADNVADKDMVRRLVAGLERHCDLAALSCYFLAFHGSTDLAKKEYLYSYTPIGGPHVLGSLYNIYGDGNALFHTSALRSIGGFTADRNTSFEDWEVFVRLVNAGHLVDVLPETLFYYRHRETGFSRVTNDYYNHERILRNYVGAANLPRAESLVLWAYLNGLERRARDLENSNASLRAQLNCLRHQVIDKLHALANHVPFARSTVRWLLKPWRRRTTPYPSDSHVNSLGSPTRSAKGEHEG